MEWNTWLVSTLDIADLITSWALRADDPSADDPSGLGRGGGSLWPAGGGTDF